MRAFLIVLAACLAGCVTRGMDQQDPIDLSKAYVILVISHSNHGWLDDLVVEARGAKGGTTAIQLLPKRLYSDPAAGVLVREPDDKLVGQMLLLEVEEGVHEIFTWQATLGSGNRGMMLVTTTLKPVTPIAPIAFRAQKGKVTYLGHLDLQLWVQSRKSRLRMLERGTRDMDLIAQRYPNVRRGMLVVDPMRIPGDSAGAR